MITEKEKEEIFDRAIDFLFENGYKETLEWQIAFYKEMFLEEKIEK